MNNAELIRALRYCSDNERDEGCDECPYLHNGMCRTMLSDAAYALEAAEKRIAELEDDLLNGTINNPERFKIYGYKLRDLILFAEMCKRNDVREEDMKQAAWNLELAVRAVMNERQEIVKNTMNEITMRFTPDFEKAFEEMTKNVTDCHAFEESER